MERRLHASYTLMFMEIKDKQYINVQILYELVTYVPAAESLIQCKNYIIKWSAYYDVMNGFDDQRIYTMTRVCPRAFIRKCKFCSSNIKCI